MLDCPFSFIVQQTNSNREDRIMSELVNSLTTEHKRMAKLLSLLDEEVNRFNEGNTLDYELVSAIVDYLTRTSQLKHHQAEDEIYKWIKIRDPEAASAINDIHLEHEKLAILSKTFQEAVSNVEQDNELPRMWLVSVANQYSTAHRNHLRLEERELFPKAIETLMASDWQDVEDHINRELDPEFERLEHEDLNDLRNDILTWHGEGLI